MAALRASVISCAMWAGCVLLGFLVYLTPRFFSPRYVRIPGGNGVRCDNMEDRVESPDLFGQFFDICPNLIQL